MERLTAAVYISPLYIFFLPSTYVDVRFVKYTSCNAKIIYSFITIIFCIEREVEKTVNGLQIYMLIIDVVFCEKKFA